MKRIAILVAGMHRSGTSALARVLNLAGCDLPETLLPANPTNEAGHWEPRNIVLLNDEILASAGTAWNDWTAIDPRWYESPVAAAFSERAAAALESEFGDSRLFVLKDPRICRLLRFWIEAARAFDADPRVAIPIRSPQDVALSLHTRDGISVPVGHLLWLRHVLDAENASRGLKRAWLRYDRFLVEPHAVLNELGKSLDVFWTKHASARIQREIHSFLVQRLRHHRIPDTVILDDPTVSRWITASFEIFNRWASGEEHEQDISALDDIRSAFDAAVPAFRQAFAADEYAIAERDTHIEALNARADERDAAIAERDTHIEALNARADERDAAIAERDAHIEALNARADERDAAIAERDTHIEALNARADERDAAIAERDAHIEALNARADERDAAIAERDTHIEALNARADERDAAIAERDTHIEALNARADERDAAIAERDTHIEALNARADERDAAIAERGRQVADHKVSIAKHLARVRKLETTVLDRENRLAELLTLRERLDWDIGQQGRYIEELRASTSWRITAPLRSLGAKWLRFHLRLQLAIYRSGPLRRLVDLVSRIVRRNSSLRFLARYAARSIPSSARNRLRDYYYRRTSTSPSVIDDSATTAPTTAPAAPPEPATDFRRYAANGQLTEGWYGGVKLHPKETCLARDEAPAAVLSQARDAYSAATKLIAERYLTGESAPAPELPSFRYISRDRCRSFLRSRRPDRSVGISPESDGYTIVTPFFRHLDDFLSTIASVDRLFFAEDGEHADAEWLIVNDDPHISTAELNRRLTPRLRVKTRIVSTEGEHGIVSALNTGIRQSRRGWLLFLDCDDEIEPHAFTVLSHYRRQFPYCRYFSSSITDIDETGKIIRFRGHEAPVYCLLDIGMLAGHLKAIRKDLFDDIGCLDPRFELCQDYEFALRTAFKEPILQIPEALYRYRWHRGTQSVSCSRRQATVSSHIKREYSIRLLNFGKLHGRISDPGRAASIRIALDLPTNLRGAAIIRTQNRRPELLVEAVESVRVQRSNLSAIVVVHGTTDDFRAVKDRLGGDDIVFLLADESVKPGRKLGFPANLALDYIADRVDRFDYLTFLDDDDILYPFFSDRMAEALAVTGADIVYSIANKRFMDGRIANGPLSLPPICLIAENFIPCNSYGLRSSVIKSLGIRFDEYKRYLDDWEFLLALFRAGVKFHFLPETLSEFRITNDGNIAEKKYPDIYADCASGVRRQARQFVSSGALTRAAFQRDMLRFDWSEPVLCGRFEPRIPDAAADMLARNVDADAPGPAVA